MFEILQFIKKTKIFYVAYILRGWDGVKILGDMVCFDITRYFGNITTCTSISVLEYCFSNTETLK